jgi:hypothetical protein
MARLTFFSRRRMIHTRGGKGVDHSHRSHRDSTSVSAFASRAAVVAAATPALSPPKIELRLVFVGGGIDATAAVVPPATVVVGSGVSGGGWAA